MPPLRERREDIPLLANTMLHRLCDEPELLGAAPAAAMGFASACGALVCLGAGGIDPQPDRAAVEAFLARMA